MNLFVCLFIYIYIHIYATPPLRPHVQQKHSIIHGSDCKCTILKLNIFSSPQQISESVLLFWWRPKSWNMQTQISCTVLGWRFDPFQVSEIPSFMNSNFGFHSNFQVQVWTWNLHSNPFRVRTLSDLKRMVGTRTQRTNYAVPTTLRPWRGGAGPRARVKTTRCRSAGLGPVGSKGLALLNESWNATKSSEGAGSVFRIPTFWLPL